MQWTKEHDDLLVKEVLALDPYSSPKGSTERSNVWDSITKHLNACSCIWKISQGQASTCAHKKLQTKNVRRDQGKWH